MLPREVIRLDWCNNDDNNNNNNNNNNDNCNDNDNNNYRSLRLKRRWEKDRMRWLSRRCRGLGSAKNNFH